MLEEIKNHVHQRRSFAFETTLSGLSYARMIPRWRSDGYTVKLIFLALATPEEAIKRVDIARKARRPPCWPDRDVIRRRFASGLKNFQNTYLYNCVDYWQGGSTTVVVFRTLIDKGEKAHD